jgi:hypothetical protein
MSAGFLLGFTRPRLVWRDALNGVGPCTVRDAPGRVGRQPCTHARFQEFDIAGKHRSEREDVPPAPGPAHPFRRVLPASVCKRIQMQLPRLQSRRGSMNKPGARHRPTNPTENCRADTAFPMEACELLPGEPQTRTIRARASGPASYLRQNLSPSQRNQLELLNYFGCGRWQDGHSLPNTHWRSNEHRAARHKRVTWGMPEPLPPPSSELPAWRAAAVAYRQARREGGNHHAGLSVAATSLREQWPDLSTKEASAEARRPRTIVDRSYSRRQSQPRPAASLQCGSCPEPRSMGKRNG